MRDGVIQLAGSASGAEEVDERGGGSPEEERSPIRDRLLQEQGALMARQSVIPLFTPLFYVFAILVFRFTSYLRSLI